MWYTFRDCGVVDGAGPGSCGVGGAVDVTDVGRVPIIDAILV